MRILAKMRTVFGKFPDPKSKKTIRSIWTSNWKFSEKNDKRDFRRHQQIKLGVFDFKQLLCLRNPIVQAVREFSTDETPKNFATSPLSKDSVEQLKHVQKAITSVDRPKKTIFATMKKYCMDKPESTYVQLRLSTRNSEHDNFQQLVFLGINMLNFCIC